MKFDDQQHPHLELEDPLDRYIGRELARAVLRRTTPDHPDAAFRVAFADSLLEQCRARVTEDGA